MNEDERIQGLYEVTDSFELKIDTTALNSDIKRAHGVLNAQIVSDCTPLVPHRTGTLRQSVHYPEGSDGDIIEWQTPYAHYMYEGVKYVNPKTMKSGYVGRDGMWHGWTGKKISTTENLTYYSEGTGSQWFLKAKAQYKEDWRDVTAKALRRG